MELLQLLRAAAPLPPAACPQRRCIPASMRSQAAVPCGRVQALAAFFVAANSSVNAWALDYNEVIQSASDVSSSSSGGLDLDAAAVDGLDFSAVDSVVSFISENPAAVIGGALAIALPVLVSKLLGNAQPWGAVPARQAYDNLSTNDPSFQLLDIRDAADIKVEGTPDLRKFKKRVVQLAFANYEGDAYVSKVLTKFKNPANTTLYILDRFDGNSTKVAKLLAENGFKAAYAIRDGAEGQKGWQKSELPWLLPRKGLSLNLDALKDVIQTDDLVPVTLGVVAAAGAGLAVFSEAETALQLVGTAALLQLFVRKFLFAEERKKTFEELKVFLDTKIAPKELVDDIKGIANRTPTTENGSAQTPAVATEVQASPPEVQYPDSSSSSSATSTSRLSSPILSPYAMYPDLKPPTSPTPSRP